MSRDGRRLASSRPKITVAMCRADFPCEFHGFTLWPGEHRPHMALDGATPARRTLDYRYRSVRHRTSILYHPD